MELNATFSNYMRKAHDDGVRQVSWLPAGVSAKADRLSMSDSDNPKFCMCCQVSSSSSTAPTAQQLSLQR